MFDPKPGDSLSQKASLAVGSRPSAFVFAGFNVANAGAGSISFLGGDEAGTFARRGDVTVGGTPTTLLTDGPDGWIDLNDDSVQDLLVADATEGTISVLLGHRDPTPRPDASPTPTPFPEASADLAQIQQRELPRLASCISLPGGAASEPVAMRLIDRVGDERTHVLVAARGTGQVLDIPIDASGALGTPTIAPAARPAAGTRRRWEPGRDYRRCVEHGCTLWVWSGPGRRARRLHVPTARGCSATDVAMWRGALAFISASSGTGRCPRGERGLWVSAGARRHRISGRATRLGDLRGQRVSWFEGNEVFGRLRVSKLDGPPRTVVGWTADDGTAFELGLLSGRFIYWLAPPDRGHNNATLKRAPAGAGGSSCRFLAPAESVESNGNHWLGRRQVAIDGKEVVYLVHRYSVFAPVVFATAPESIRWRPCR